MRERGATPVAAGATGTMWVSQPPKMRNVQMWSFPKLFVLRNGASC